MDKAVFIGLVDRYIEGKATEAERQWVETYFRRLEAEDHERLSPEQEEALGRLLSENISRHISDVETESAASPEDRLPRLKRIFPYTRYWVAAAAVALVVAGGDYLFNRWKDTLPASVAAGRKMPADIQPGGDKAVLTLADGRVITLDSARNGALATQGNAVVSKLQNGQLVYANEQPGGADAQPASLAYNTVTTPRGGQYEVVLPDGSKAWLDAASSLRFPTAFGGRERVVELTGQGYFEISVNKAMPFHVKAGGTDIEVLGTHFNINAYTDENAVRTTLLEGSVRVKSGSDSRVLAQGEQASYTKDQEIRVARDADVDAVIAWKNGLFQFSDAALEEVMRQLNRWYDVEVVYEGAIPHQQFEGKMQRNLTLSQVLRILERSQVHFTLEDRKIIVKP
jgi:transmembrane sensor